MAGVAGRRSARARLAVAGLVVTLALLALGRWGRLPAPGAASLAMSILLLALVGLAAHAGLRAVRKSVWRALDDPLTGLANRSTFSGHLARSLERRRADELVGVVYLDLDGFKAVNDLRGHQAGDQLLILVAQRIRQCVKQQDVAARLGGDEFAILLEGLGDGAHADAVGERVLEALSLPFVLGSSQVRVSASIGVATADTESVTADLLLDRADTAMYSAKAEGKGRVLRFVPDMLEARRARLELELSLQEAVVDDLIRVHYQPVVDLRTGRVLGFEALARWTDPQLGSVSPEAFIAAAESAGLIRTLGVQLLERAHEGGRQLVRAAGRPLSLAVNMSATQVTDPELSTRLVELQRMGTDVELVLELTESMLIENDEETVRALERLKATGVTLAIDDFGTGFSSLGYLDRLPVDVLKIDRSFVAKLPNARSTALVRGIIAMAESLGLTVISEGIEEWGDVVALRDLNCQVGQGYLFGRALDLPAALALAARGSVDLAGLSVGPRSAVLA